MVVVVHDGFVTVIDDFLLDIHGKKWWFIDGLTVVSCGLPEFIGY